MFWDREPSKPVKKLIQLVPKDGPIYTNIPQTLAQLALGIESGLNGEIVAGICIFEEKLPEGGFRIRHTVLGEKDMNHAAIMCERAKFKLMNGD